MTNERYPKSLRVARRAEMDRVFAEGLRFARESILLVAAKNGGRPTRFGISISKRVGNAPQRNRVKRCLREAFRMQRLKIPTGLDLVAVPRLFKVGMNLAAAAEAIAPLFEEARRVILEGQPRSSPPQWRKGRPGRRSPRAKTASGKAGGQRRKN